MLDIEKIKEAAPYGATNAGVKGSTVDYLIISRDGIILRWSYAECDWYGANLSFDDMWEYYDNIIEVNEGK